MSIAKFNKTVDQFSNTWLNKKGIWGIESRTVGKNKIIVLYVNLDEIDYDKIPKQHNGIQILIKPVEEFAALVR